MVYDRASREEGIDEMHPVKPASPYAGSKIAGENLVLSYWHAYKLPTVVIRPFNTYGPFQKSGGEGGVIAIFIKNFLEGRGFLEVDTPILTTIAGGANARPFSTHHNTLDIELKLRISNELYLKRLIVGGLDLSLIHI